jgi:phosphonate transport system permease protein
MTPITTKTQSNSWQLRQPITLKLIGILLLIAMVLAVTARDAEIPQGLQKSTQAVGAVMGFGDSSAVRGAKRLADDAFPMVLMEETEVSRLSDFDETDLPWLSFVQVKTTKEYDAETSTWTSYESKWLIEPYGYAIRIFQKMIETIEIALWGTIFAILLAIPLAFFSAKNLVEFKFPYLVARGICSFNRAIPDMIYALIFVVMFGFGPYAGVLALAIHTSGFLGKFFADEIENSDMNTQQALQSVGADKIQTLIFSILPQIAPQIFSYAQYILERNIRMATVLGIVGAGGIGMELKGRWDMFDYGRVSTILLAMFITVFLLEHLTQLARRKYLKY